MSTARPDNTRSFDHVDAHTRRRTAGTVFLDLPSKLTYDARLCLLGFRRQSNFSSHPESDSRVIGETLHGNTDDEPTTLPARVLFYVISFQCAEFECVRTHEYRLCLTRFSTFFLDRNSYFRFLSRKGRGMGLSKRYTKLFVSTIIEYKKQY